MKALLILVGISLVSCNHCNIEEGSYGDQMLFITVHDSVVKGILDFKQGFPEVTCYLEFQLNRNENCGDSVEFIDSFGNKYAGRIESKNNEILIQSLEPLGACQRIIDLNRGETFSLDE